MTGLSVLSTQAVKSYADYEQLVGGVETLFGTGGKSIEEYADSVGKSVEDISEEYEILSKAQEQCLSNARKAYKDAGLSQNEYMETVTSFAASLKQSVKDEVEAAEAADQAVIDMADNANKMGSSMESIQNAYQGFAKQNYTMLDNLKLGYGGTKEEMERLLRDAEKLHEKTTGEVTHYSMDNLSDVFSAIHDVQVELGITGTTAKEAATTISGSMNMAKSAWSNLLVGISSDSSDFNGLVNDFVDSVAIAADNLIPRVEIALSGVGNLVEQILPAIVARIPELLENVAPQLMQSGVNMITSIITGIRENLPQITESAINIVTFLIESFAGMLPELLETGIQLIGELALGIANALPTLLETISEVLPQMIESLSSGAGDLAATGFEILSGLIEGIVDAIPEKLPEILAFIQSFADGLAEQAPVLIEKGFELLSMLVDGIIEAVPILIENVPTIISTFANIINDYFPTILAKGAELILQLIMGLISAIPTLIENIPQIISAIVDTIQAFQWLNLGKNIIEFFGKGIKNMIGFVKEAGGKIHESLVNTIKNLPGKLMDIGKNAISGMGSAISGMKDFIAGKAKVIFDVVKNTIKGLPNEMLSIGKNLVEGLWNGISEMTGWLLDKIGGFASSIIGGIKDFFDIHSPSRKFKWIGKMCIAGFEEPFEDFMDKPLALTKNVQASLSTAKANARGTMSENGVGGFGTFNQTINVNQQISTPDELARATRLESKYGLMKGIAYG